MRILFGEKKKASSEITVDLRSRPGKYDKYMYGWMYHHWSLSFNALDWTDHGSCLFGVCVRNNPEIG